MNQSTLQRSMNTYHSSKRKRVFDLLITLLVFPLVFPFLSLCMLLLLVLNGTPIFYTQERVGKDGRRFNMYKLRTMKRKFKNFGGTMHTNADITRLGLFLRIIRLDEIPQIINILKGEMSWVGPRPEVPFYVEKYSALDSDYHLRHRVLPGITGLAQVEYPNATPCDNLKKLKYDLKYIKKGNLELDIRLFFMTFLAVLKRKKKSMH